MKNKSRIIDKKRNINVILLFVVILSIYTFGLLAGCNFVYKDSRNMEYVQNIISVSKNNLLFFLKDIFLILLIYKLKYSGLFSGLNICVPFIYAVQNSCIYTLQHCLKSDIFELFMLHLIKDTAIAFIIIMYSCIALNDTLKRNGNRGKDKTKVIVYICGISLVHIINYAINIMYK